MSVSLSLNISRDGSLVFSKTLHEVLGQYSKESDKAGIKKKDVNLGSEGD